MIIEKSLSNSKHSNSSDAFGQAAWDYYNNISNKGTHVIEREDGYIDVTRSSTMQMYFSNFKDWFPIEKTAIKFARGKVLDIGCGAGRHCLYLQKKNHYVLGIDNSPLAIKVAKARGLKHAIVLNFENVEQLKPLRFDTILMLGHNFGLFGSFRNTRMLLTTLYSLTTPHGLIMASTLNPYGNSPEHKEYHKLNKKRGRMGGQVRIRIRYKKLIGPWLDYLFVSQTELKQILSGTGWKIKKIFTQKDSPIYSMILNKK